MQIVSKYQKRVTILEIVTVIDDSKSIKIRNSGARVSVCVYFSDHPCFVFYQDILRWCFNDTIESETSLTYFPDMNGPAMTDHILTRVRTHRARVAPLSPPPLGAPFLSPAGPGLPCPPVERTT